jgi:hypothetical protein
MQQPDSPTLASGRGPSRRRWTCLGFAVGICRLFRDWTDSWVELSPQPVDVAPSVERGGDSHQFFPDCVHAERCTGKSCTVRVMAPTVQPRPRSNPTRRTRTKKMRSVDVRQQHCDSDHHRARGNRVLVGATAGGRDSDDGVCRHRRGVIEIDCDNKWYRSAASVATETACPSSLRRCAFTGSRSRRHLYRSTCYSSR